MKPGLDSMLHGNFFNLAVQGATPPLVHVFGTLLFFGIFLFLRRQSGVLYLGYWSLAWAIESLALISTLASASTGLPVFFWLHALLEFCFALALLRAARSAVDASSRTEKSSVRSALRSIILFPGLLLLIYVFAWRLDQAQFRALHCAVLALIYGYSFFSIGIGSSLQNGIGGKLLRVSLAWLWLQFAAYSAAYLYAAASGDQDAWMLRIYWLSVFDLVPQTLLAFSAAAMWIQTQQGTISQLRTDIALLQQENAGTAELDHLTGLLNRLALDRSLSEEFSGVVAVCDMDNFKIINDKFGHLVGDEVLRSVGHLIRASIRSEDEAFRWGGDEFVILFRNQRVDLVLDRMTALESRLKNFRIRGHGLFPLLMSWGAAEGDRRILRPILEEADLQMYEHKRQAHAQNS